MNHEVCAEPQWLLQGGRQESVVNGQQRPRLARQPRHFGNIDNSQQRVGRRFHEDEPWLAVTDFPQRGGARLVDERDLEMTFGCKALEQSVTAAVAVMRRYQQVPGLQKLANECQGRHSRRSNDRSRSMLEFR